MEWTERIFEAEDPILIRKVKQPFGWMGNMSPHPVKHEGHEYRTCEALFQCLRVEDEAVREAIRAEKSPMGAKLKAKKHSTARTIECLTPEDLDLMRLTLRVKLEHHRAFVDRLLETGDRCIVEDCSRRQRGTGLFWGAALRDDGSWAGMNWLGELWMELRRELAAAKPEPEDGIFDLF